MIVSQRRMTFEGSPLDCDRWILPECVIRRSYTEGFSQDERMTIEALGRGTEDRVRARVLVVLDGTLELSVDGQTKTGTAGAFMAASAVARTLSFGGGGLCHAVSLDWIADRPFAGFGTMGARARVTLEAISEAIGRKTRPSVAELEVLVRSLRESLRAEGLEVPALEEVITAPEPADQAAMNAFDTLLTRLAESPTSADWETATSATRRTLTRKSHALHQKYGLFGLRRQTDWRAVKDFYRLLMGAMFLSHRDATVAGVARAVGYRSPAALCHAFAQAGLPPPGRVRALAAA